MTEKRKFLRLQKRLKVRYGVTAAANLAFTEDFSEYGVFIRATNVLLPGSKMLVELFLPDNETVIFEAKVVWGKRIPGSLMHITKKSGMGVVITKFLANEEKYSEYCRCLAEQKKAGGLHTPPTEAAK